jgi:hypothetical protein
LPFPLTIPDALVDDPDFINHVHLLDWWDYHIQNPSTYHFFVRMARRAKEKGYQKTAIKYLLEVGRWEMGQSFSLADGFSHNYQPLYSRLIMCCESDLVDFFEVRQLKAVHTRQQN